MADVVDQAEPAPRAPPRGVHDMTRGSVRGHIVRMMTFILTGLAIQTLYSVVDIYWVSRLGKEAVAAVALSSNLMFVSLAVTQMLSVGCVALVSQAAGRKDHDEVQRLFNQAQSLSTFVGIIFLVICMATRHIYAERLGSDAATIALAEEFLAYFIPALALQLPMVGLGSSLRGIGDMKPGLIAQMLSVMLNMVLAPFLVFGWGTGYPLGVAGAGLATLISTVAAVIGLWIYLVRGKTFLRLRFAAWRPDWQVWRRMIGIGLPAGTEFILTSIMMGVIYVVTRSFGAEAQAGFGLASRILQAGFMPAVAISFSAAAVVGQNLGSREYGRVHETFREAAKLTIGFMLALSVLCHVAPEALIRIFSDEPTVVAVGADYLEIVTYVYVASGLVFVIAGVFQGLGNTWPSLWASGLRTALFVIAVIVVSRQPFELHTLWLVSVGTSVLQLALCLWLVSRELRLKAPRTAKLAS